MCYYVCINVRQQTLDVTKHCVSQASARLLERGLQQQLWHCIRRRWRKCSSSIQFISCQIFGGNFLLISCHFLGSLGPPCEATCSSACFVRQTHTHTQCTCYVTDLHIKKHSCPCLPVHDANNPKPGSMKHRAACGSKLQPATALSPACTCAS